MVKLCDRLSELDVLLNYIDPADWIKIPDEVIFYIKENKNDEYIWEYDVNKSLEDQNLSKDTFSLLTFIMYKYIATAEERKEMEHLLDENIKNDLENTETTEIKKDVNLIKIDENRENFFSRLLVRIKQIFKKN